MYVDKRNNVIVVLYEGLEINLIPPSFLQTSEMGRGPAARRLAEGDRPGEGHPRRRNGQGTFHRSRGREKRAAATA